MQLKKVKDHSLEKKKLYSNHDNAIEYTEEIENVPANFEQNEIYYTEPMDLGSEFEIKLRLLIHFVNDFHFNSCTGNIFLLV